MRYFKTVVNGKIKRIDSCDIPVSGEEITKAEYEEIKKSLAERRNRNKIIGVNQNE